MTTSPSESSAPTFRPLRTWPALLLVVVLLAARFGPTIPEDGMSRYWMIAAFGPLLCMLLILIWWAAASRATWKERLFGVLGLIGSLIVVTALSDPSMRGPATTYIALPIGIIAFALGTTWLAKRRPLVRTGGSVLIAALGFATTVLMRNEGMTGDFQLTLRPRWSRTAEDALVASRASAPANAAKSADSAAAAPKVLTQLDWPGFRGADRSGLAHSAPLATNWAVAQPKPLWKIQVGPGWSSIAVAGSQLFTQEQRGPQETVVCYDAATGRELWNHAIEARFDEALGGPGPRATPTVTSNALYVTGATGKFMRLNPANGAVVWQTDLKETSGRAALPNWGFAASPLVVGSVVVVYAGGPGNQGVLAFDIESGAPKWSAAAGGESYSSPQLARLAGEDLVLMLTNEGLVGLDPVNGAERFNHAWKFMNYRALQPAVIGDDIVLIPTGMNTGTRAIKVTKADGKLVTQELWTSRNLKPDFSDFVVLGGHAYGFDGGIFTCVDLKAGERRWKGGRYGKGQVLGLQDRGLLLVAAESGDIALVRADPSDWVELGTFKAIEGKTWNHPVVVGDRLYVRNAQEAAAFQLAVAGP